MKSIKKVGVTLLELVIVLLILSILSSIAITVYTGHVRRAQFAAAKVTIKELELNVHRYEIDLGDFPPSSSGTTFGANAINPTKPTVGDGYLTLALLHSLSGNATRPASSRWQGPYMTVDQGKQGDVNGNVISSSTAAPSVCILDPWSRPYYYTRSSDYAAFGATKQLNSAFATAGETFYNPSTFQIFSLGPDGVTLPAPNKGLGADDTNNFNNP
jgi:prepilin-type N-terminal cleavage/methylation domain-containing protein